MADSVIRPLTRGEMAERRGVDYAGAKALGQVGPDKRVLYIPPDDRRRIANRLMVRPPANTHEVAEFQKFYKEHARVAGLPAEVLVRLEVLADLAEGGNSVAAFIYTAECKKFGISFPRRF